MRKGLDSLRRWFARIWLRLLAFNVLLVFLPVAASFTLQIYEEQLLQRQERAMAELGRLLASTLGGEEQLDPERARAVLVRLQGRTRARLRVLDDDGQPVADTSVLGRRETSPAQPTNTITDTIEEAPEQSWLYRIGAFPFRLMDRLQPEPPLGQVDDARAGSTEPSDWPEVQKALAGAYGADSRLTAGGQRSLTLYSALPIRNDTRVIGVALVSQSTYHILRDLYEVRLSLFKIFLGSVVVAIVISLMVATTIARPLRRLRRETTDLLDARGRLQGDFAPTERRDEIGDLTRSLRDLAGRLADYQDFTESFAADLSHEFKNPLASIRSATEVLAKLDSASEQGDRDRFLDLIRRDINRLERLLSTLRELTSIDAGLSTDEETDRIELGSLTAGLVEGWRRRLAQQAGERDVTVRFDAPTDPPIVFVSPDRLSQIVDNLLDNAASFSPPGSTVDVSVARNGQFALLRVRDHGPGIPAEHTGRVFERFFSYRPGQEHKGDHSGLGLPIVRAIAESYGGRVDVGNAEGGGAIFEVRLPLATAAPAA